MGAGAELLQTSDEDLKQRVLEKLAPPAKAAPPAAAAAEAGGVRKVYLMCDNGDAEAVRPIDDYLYEQCGFDVINSAVSFEGADVAQAHRQSLLECDGALIYYGKAHEMWLRSKLSDLDKARAWGRTSPLAAKAVYVGTAGKRFRAHGVPLLSSGEGFQPDAIQPFVRAVRAGEGVGL